MRTVLLEDLHDYIRNYDKCKTYSSPTLGVYITRKSEARVDLWNPSLYELTKINSLNLEINIFIPRSRSGLCVCLEKTLEKWKISRPIKDFTKVPSVHVLYSNLVQNNLLEACDEHFDQNLFRQFKEMFLTTRVGANTNNKTLSSEHTCITLQ